MGTPAKDWGYTAVSSCFTDIALPQAKWASNFAYNGVSLVTVIRMQGSRRTRCIYYLSTCLLRLFTFPGSFLDAKLSRLPRRRTCTCSFRLPGHSQILTGPIRLCGVYWNRKLVNRKMFGRFLSQLEAKIVQSFGTSNQIAQVLTVPGFRETGRTAGMACLGRQLYICIILLGK